MRHGSQANTPFGSNPGPYSTDRPDVPEKRRAAGLAGLSVLDPPVYLIEGCPNPFDPGQPEFFDTSDPARCSSRDSVATSLGASECRVADGLLDPPTGHHEDRCAMMPVPSHDGQDSGLMADSIPE